MRVGAVDIGTNTVRLLVAESGDGRLGEELAYYTVVTRLGQGVDGSGALHHEAISRTLEALRRCGNAMDELAAGRRRAIATSAARDAANADLLLDEAAAVLGVRPEIIDGAEEARLSFAGATRLRRDLRPVLVIDVGGGSTEFVAGTNGPTHAHSVDIGSVRMTERCLPRLPAGAAHVAAARSEAADLFASQPTLPTVDSVIGVAGTYTTLAAVHLELAEYDRSAVDGTVLTTAVLGDLVDRLAAMTLGEIEAIPSMDPARAPVILGGAVVAEQALLASGHTELTVSESDILDGVALSLLR